MKKSYLSIHDITRFGYSDELSEFLQKELPIRYAHRIKLLETVPDWKTIPDVKTIHGMYKESFAALISGVPGDFEQVLRNVKYRHINTTKLVNGFRHIKANKLINDVAANTFLDNFFVSRISTNLLVAHYLNLVENPNGVGIARTDWQIADVCKLAAKNVQLLCEDYYDRSPEITVTAQFEPTSFPCVPQYVYYIVFELLKNAARACVENRMKKDIFKELPRIGILISGDEQVLAIRVSDEGGGIPLNSVKNVFSYLHTTARELPCTDGQNFVVDEPLASSSMKMHTLCSNGAPSPLAGLGCGLPLSRLYARYLGGNLILKSMPRLGCDVVVYLNRIGNESEAVVKDFELVQKQRK